MIRTTAVAIVALLLTSGAGLAQERWIAGWVWAPVSTAGPVVPPSPPNPDDVRGPLGLATVANQTVSQTVTVSATGERLRLRLSNLYGAAPIRVGSVSVAIGSATPIPVTFDGAASLVLPAGSPRLSDPLALHIRALDRVTVSVFYPDETRLPNHRLRQAVREGDAAGQPLAADAQRWRMGALASAIEVETDPAAGVIVAFGDSITEGTGSLPSGPGGWPERLARRMVAADAPWSVVNAGIGGNRLLHQGSGPSGLERLDSDALAISGARCLILLEGINDLGRPTRPEYAHESITAEDLITGYRQVIARAHAAGIRLVMATLPPFEGANFFSPNGEAIRQAANSWIRTSGEADAVVDFDAAVRDPDHPLNLGAAHDSGDRLHPSDAGYDAMAAAISLDVCEARRGALRSPV